MKKFFGIIAIALAIFSFSSSPTRALDVDGGIGGIAGISLEDEGILQGLVSSLDCVGAGVTCTASAADGTITVTGGGGGSVVYTILALTTASPQYSLVGGVTDTWTLLPADVVNTFVVFVEANAAQNVIVPLSAANGGSVADGEHFKFIFAAATATSVTLTPTGADGTESGISTPTLYPINATNESFEFATANLTGLGGNFWFRSENGIPTGGGDVVGPGSAVDSNAACFDTTSGKLLKDCGGSISGGTVTSGAHSGTNTGDEVQATESVDGIGQVATQVETDAGSLDTVFLTPLKLANASAVGDVDGPGSSVSGNAACFSGTTGKILSDCGGSVSGGSMTGGTNTGDEVQATESVDGTGQVATQVETDAGSLDTVFITPLKLANYGNFPTTLFDGTICSSGCDHTSFNASYTAGNRRVLIEGNTTETAQTTITESIFIYVDRDVVFTLDATSNVVIDSSTAGIAVRIAGTGELASTAARSINLTGTNPSVRVDTQVTDLTGHSGSAAIDAGSTGRVYYEGTRLELPNNDDAFGGNFQLYISNSEVVGGGAASELEPNNTQPAFLSNLRFSGTFLAQSGLYIKSGTRASNISGAPDTQQDGGFIAGAGVADFFIQGGHAEGIIGGALDIGGTSDKFLADSNFTTDTDITMDNVEDTHLSNVKIRGALTLASTSDRTKIDGCEIGVATSNANGLTINIGATDVLIDATLTGLGITDNGGTNVTLGDNDTW